MDAWMVWVVLAVILAAAELLSLSLVLVPFAAAAVLGALTELAGWGSVVAMSVFVLSSGLLLVRVRPIARRHLSAPPRIRSGAAALVGQTAVVLERVDDQAGAVKLDGEVWTARTYADDEVIAAGRRVHVVEIKGATALVSETV